jgi:hypothetical protein
MVFLGLGEKNKHAAAAATVLHGDVTIHESACRRLATQGGQAHFSASQSTHNWLQRAEK